MTLPGGAVYQAVRLKTDTRSTSPHGSYSRSIGYKFLTSSGASVSVTPTDTNQPNVGTINISSSSWNGPTTTTSVQEIGAGYLPSRFDLEQNYPNPFNPSTTIQFSVPENSFVTLKVYNLLGEELSTIVSERLERGTYSAQWDGSKFPSGVYVYRLRSGTILETRKLILMR
jgi:hypothetical protein